MTTSPNAGNSGAPDRRSAYGTDMVPSTGGGDLGLRSLRASDLVSRYRSASPWPHLVLDGVLDGAVVDAAEREEMPFALSLPSHRSHRQIKAESPEVSGPAAASILAGLVTPSFVEFLAELTGIPSLLPDPSFFWAGLHVGVPGSFQAVHADFRRQASTGLYHRANVLVYLNSDWSDEYGGHLELWDKGITSCGARISPVAGRMVIFETGADTYHGVPDRLTCPPDRVRLTLAAYFYTKEPPPADRRRPYLRRPRRPEDPWLTGVASPADATASSRVLARDLRRHLRRR
jgi:hypothetical protein